LSGPLIEWAYIFPGGSRLQHHLLDLASECIPLCTMSAACEHKAVENRLSLGNPTLKAAFTAAILQSFFFWSITICTLVAPFTVRMELVYSSETWVLSYQTVRCYY